MPRSPGTDLRKKILEEAVGIVYREGVERITMRALAEKLGYSPATIYLYFRSKDDLLGEIAAHGFSLLLERSRDAFDLDDPVAAVAAAGRSYVDFGLEYPELYRLMFQELGPMRRNGELVGRALEIWELHRNLYERGIASGRFRPSNAQIQAVTGWSMVHGYVQLALSGRVPGPIPDTSMVELRDRVLDGWIRMLAPDPEPKK